MLLLGIIRWLSPGLLAILLLVCGVVGFQNYSLRHQVATLSAEVMSTKASLELSRANAERLGAGIDIQNAGIDRQGAEGAARVEATTERLRAFPDAAMPAIFDAPLTGATACERADEVRGRLLEAIQ